MSLPQALRNLADMLDDESVSKVERGAMCCSALFGIIGGLLDHPEIRDKVVGAFVRDSEIMDDAHKLHAFFESLIVSKDNP